MNTSPPLPPMETTYKKAINSIRSQAKNASSRSVHIYSFNIPPGQLAAAYTLLDKQEGRKSMRLTYSDEYNFIIRYMPGQVHNATQVYFNMYTAYALAELRSLPVTSPAGCNFYGATAFQVGLKKKQADACILPDQSDYPSIVLEVGDSECLGQLKIDAKLWIEHVPEIQLVILIFIDPPTAPNANPRITVQLWRGLLSVHPRRTAAAQQREARMVWPTDWTQATTPMYLLLSDIFRGPAPVNYGNNTQVNLDTMAWRREIINASV